MGYKQALYVLMHPEKYLGDPIKLIYKSSWEQKVFEMCDNNPNIVKWGYEIFPINYMKPTENNIFVPSKYFPDVYVEYFDRDKNFIKELLEIKPLKQTKQSRSKNPIVKMYENYVTRVNLAKWDAAERWCAMQGIKFSIITEKSLFARKKK